LIFGKKFSGEFLENFFVCVDIMRGIDERDFT